MIYLIKRLPQINRSNSNSASSIIEVIYDSFYRVNCHMTAGIFFKAKLSNRSRDFIEMSKYAVFKDFRYNRAYSYASKVINITVFLYTLKFRNWLHDTPTEVIWNTSAMGIYIKTFC